ncbi:MAG: aminotransferase class I/II-fold pyridoxal phosphate-dependent enzyme [Bacillota bacterium]
MQYKHGGDIFESTSLLDFSININPLGMPKEIATALVAAVAGADVYPDYKCRKLSGLLGAKHGVSESQIVIGNGASEIICAVSRLGFKTAVVIQPTFSEYKTALETSGVEVCDYIMGENLEFGVQDAKKIPQCDVCFLCNPNNPTGKFAGADAVRALATHLQSFGGTLVLDECFIDFVADGVSGIQLFETCKNIIIIRAFTKIFAMAGVRLGYAICSCENVAQSLQTQLPMWNVSHLAQKAGETAIEKCDDFGGMLEVVASGRRYLENSLLFFGFKVYISDANFILFETDFDLKTPLLAKGILIRDASNFVGLRKNMFRVCVATMEKNQSLIRAIVEVMIERSE